METEGNRSCKTGFHKSSSVDIDYDPSATRVNQENRIKLMLAVARERLAQQSADDSAHHEAKEPALV